MCLRSKLGGLSDLRDLDGFVLADQSAAASSVEH
jgi:hypothetical protein